jgi:predicted anti-sigma-YlaC factor YlaD
MTADATELTCRDVSEFLARYLDGAMGPDERARFDEHLAECPDCVAYLRDYTDTVRLARDAFADADADAPADVPDDLRRAILAARTPSPRRRR